LPTTSRNSRRSSPRVLTLVTSIYDT
jgi:hypothetical protein